MSCLPQLAFWLTNLQQFYKNEEGQSVAEYTFLVLAVVFLVIGMMSVLLGPLSELYATITLTFRPFINQRIF